MKAFLRALAVLLCLCAVISPIYASAEETDTMAEDISASTTVTGTGYNSFRFLTDKNIDYYRTAKEGCTITLENPQGIASLYLLFNKEYGDYTVTDTQTGDQFIAGTNRFLHEFIDLEAAFGNAPVSVEIAFENGAVSISEIFLFSHGQTPDFVQKWQPPHDGGADILLLCAHGDDDQLYFAGLFPLYAGERGCRVQVAYMTDHRNYTYERTHEMLNGLWQTGITAYPVFGSFPDFRIDSMEQTYQEYARRKYSEEKLVGYVVELLRRFHPQVAIGHDFKGEYGHGMHMVYADMLAKAVKLSNDPVAYQESAEKYGLWDVPKTYFHLYKENPIVIDYDTPLESFDGLTAFQATQQYGFPCHKTQQYSNFVGWLYGYGREITKASQITKYNPSQFGLYRSTVGLDVEKNDFLENLTTYGEQERIEQERLEQIRQEKERLEKERLEKERLEKERLEKERLEQEQAEQERQEQARLEQERILQELQEVERKQKLFARIVLIGGIVLGLLIVVYIVTLTRKKKKEKIF